VFRERKIDIEMITFMYSSLPNLSTTKGTTNESALGCKNERSLHLRSFLRILKGCRASKCLARLQSAHCKNFINSLSSYQMGNSEVSFGNLARLQVFPPHAPGFP
jgi:hypothetical protein